MNPSELTTQENFLVYFDVILHYEAETGQFIHLRISHHKRCALGYSHQVKFLWSRRAPVSKDINSETSQIRTDYTETA
jgi:hypothetical protein